MDVVTGDVSLRMEEGQQVRLIHCVGAGRRHRLVRNPQRLVLLNVATAEVRKSACGDAS